MIPAAVPLGRHLSRLLAPCILRAAATPGADRYRKHFPATAHLWLLVLHGLLGFPSLRQAHAALAVAPGLFARIGLTQGLSLSQLARSSTSRPTACFEALLADVTAQARRSVPADPAWRLLRKVQIVDSTFVVLSAKLSPWSQHGGHTPGIRVHTVLDVARHLPTHLWFSLADLNDHEALMHTDLTPCTGWTLVLDLGYYGHRQLARLRAAGVSFVSRLHPQARYTITATRTVSAKRTPDGDLLFADETITLGSPHNRNGVVLPNLRLITSANPAGQMQRFVTDRFDLTAPELVRLYRKRWQIELFFRFLKQQLGVTHPLGQSRDAVWLTILLAVIIAVLLALLSVHRPDATSAIAWLHACGMALLTTLRSG
jgi:DDE family transposase